MGFLATGFAGDFTGALVPDLAAALVDDGFVVDLTEALAACFGAGFFDADFLDADFWDDVDALVLTGFWAMGGVFSN
jgi:hypothetical protein